MFESIFNTAGEMATISWQRVAATMGVAFLLGVFISYIYMKTHKTGAYSQSFVLTLVMLPIIIALIILLIGSNVARAFSLAGAFSIIRFRSSMGDPKDISYVFFTMAVGLALGVGFIGYAIIFAIVLCLFMILLCKTNFGKKKDLPKTLKILVPEDLDYSDAFEDILGKYTKEHQMLRVKTTDLGSLYELTYNVYLKDEHNEKDFLDELRCRNGNLTITISLKESAD